MLHSLQAVHHSAESGHTSPSCRYLRIIFWHHWPHHIIIVPPTLPHFFFFTPFYHVKNVFEHSMNQISFFFDGSFMTKLMRFSEKAPPTPGTETYPAMRGYFQWAHWQFSHKREIHLHERCCSLQAKIHTKALTLSFTDTHTHLPRWLSKFHLNSFFCAQISCTFISRRQVQREAIKAQGWELSDSHWFWLAADWRIVTLWS